HLTAISAVEIVMHRVVWSFLFLIPLLILQKRWGAFISVLKKPRLMGVLCATTLLVGFNWLIFIWAVIHDHILQASLGYYINPLVNMLLGAIFLKERLRPPQLAAVILAGAGVLYLTLDYGETPWVSLSLAFTFGFYGLIRKVAPVSALEGLSVETLLLCPAALGGLVYLDVIGSGAFLRTTPGMSLLLMAAALVTALPLLFFNKGARRLHLTTIGFMQYIAPSCTFLLAVFIYGEPMPAAQLVTFGMIWAALALYSADSVFYFRRKREALGSSGGE
ncbi:MAG: EamA family transporter RarD, partial [Desulfobacterales bacterium]|nr:EamA family transporter RarD [Desulfobacterales bacterium]